MRFNLNLLFALEAILEAPTLTAAARAMRLTQPAMSMSLARLRQTFGDPLVVYQAGRAALTPLGHELRPRVRDVLTEARDLLALSRAFDPQTDARTWKIVVADPLMLLFAPRVEARLRRLAPQIALRFVPLSDLGEGRLNWGEADLAITPGALMRPDWKGRRLMSEALGCICAPSCPEIFDARTFLEREHVVSSAQEEALFGAQPAAAQLLLADRRVAARANRDEAVPFMVQAGDLIATTLMSCAQQWASNNALEARGAPEVFEPVVFHLQWRPHRDDDLGLAWLIDQVMLAARAHQSA